MQPPPKAYMPPSLASKFDQVCSLALDDCIFPAVDPVTGGKAPRVYPSPLMLKIILARIEMIEADKRVSSASEQLMEGARRFLAENVDVVATVKPQAERLNLLPNTSEGRRTMVYKQAEDLEALDEQ